MAPLWRAAVGALLAVAVGCGSSGAPSSPAQAFVGVWGGEMVGTIDGQSGSFPDTIPIEQLDPTTVRLHGFCGNGTDIYADGPEATVNGSTLTLEPGSCPTWANFCSPASLQVVSGSGWLSAGFPSATLTFTLTANLSGCGSSVSETMIFTSSGIRRPYGYSTTAPGPEDAPASRVLDAALR